MRVAIIGTGFTGLTAAYRLSVQNHSVTLFEKEGHVGGLGAGFKHQVEDYPKEWDWDLERYYHHWFTNDTDIFSLLKEIGEEKNILTLTPKTSSLYNDKIYQIDSPIALLKFSPLPIIERIRTGIVVGIFKYLIRDGTFLERWKVHDVIPKLMGKQSYKVIWEPLMEGKFAEHAHDVNLAWLWARIHKRTPNLAYFAGGFQAAAESIAKKISENKGAFLINTTIDSITRENNEWVIHSSNEKRSFDAIIVTTSPSVFMKLFPSLPESYTQKYGALKGIGAQVLILRMKTSFFPDGTYWLNIHDPSWPFLIVAEHTNFVDKKHYNNEVIVYVGNYLSKEHALMQLDKEALLSACVPYLKQVNPSFTEDSVLQTWLWRSPYAQPIVEVNHSHHIPPLTTPLSNVYLASMSQVYPWDRGTNYAVKIGEEVAQLVHESTVH